MLSKTSFYIRTALFIQVSSTFSCETRTCPGLQGGGYREPPELANEPSSLASSILDLING